jgi:hypothetical protein
MECDHLHGTMLDAAAKLISSPPEFQRHLSSCVKCSSEFDELRKTIDLLEEWRAPYPSARFDEGLRAKLISVKPIVSVGWRLSLQPTMFVLSLVAVLLVVTLTLQRTETVPTSPILVDKYVVEPPTGSAVADLQYMDEGYELFADFDLLDELAPDQQNASSRE